MCSYRIYDIRIFPDHIAILNNAGVSTSKLIFEGHMYVRDHADTFKYLAELGRDLYEGRKMFAKTSKCKAKKVYENCKRRHGTSRNHIDDPNAKKYRERFASEFARRMCA